MAELGTDFDADLPPVVCLPGEFNQVILNMIVNAADAIGEKHGDNSGQKGLITVRTRSDEAHIVIEVEDTGGGVPDEIRGRIFDPFFTTKDVGKGTGQGLAISYDVVVNKHGGTLEVESTPGVGSLFRVTIPVLSPVVRRRPPTPYLSRPPNRLAKLQERESPGESRN